MNDADLPHLVIGACLNVHGRLGPGLFREAYEECMAIELRELEMDFRRAVPLDFTYREHEVRNAARLDFIVQDQLLLPRRLVDADHRVELGRTEAQAVPAQVGVGWADAKGMFSPSGTNIGS